MNKTPNTLAVTNMGDKLAAVNAIKKRGQFYSIGLKNNVLDELRKGVSVIQVSRKFGLKTATVFKWRFDEFGPVHKQGAKTGEAKTILTPNSEIPPPAAISKALAPNSPAKAETRVSLTAQEARVLSLIVRDAVARMGNEANQEVKGKLAVLALKLLV